MFGTYVSFIAFVAMTASCFVTSSLIPSGNSPSIYGSYVHTYIYVHVATTTTHLTLTEEYQRLKFSKEEISQGPCNAHGTD